MTKKAIPSLLACLITFSGCDTPVQYKFVAENSTDKDITLNFTTPHVKAAVKIPAHQSALLTKTVEITKTRDDYFKDGMHVFDAIEITQDGVPSSRRIHERRFWKLTWMKADSAIYTVTIDFTFF